MLPAEVEQIAMNVSVEKRNEVQAVLNHVFNGVAKMREQLDGVAVVDENDKTNMQIARTIRLGVRQIRLDAEKQFDAKRTEVQSAMVSFKTEDQLWLKAKQTMQILTKEIEETAKWKEETKERIEAERKELKTQQRIAAASKFSPDITRFDVENLSDQMFDAFLAGIEKQHSDMIAEELRIKKEAEELARKQEEERKRIKEENERLKKEAEDKERQLAAERAKAEADKKAAEAAERDRIAKEQAEREKERKAYEEKLAAERKEREAAEASERAKREAAERELKAKKDAEEKAKKEAEAAAKKAAAAPDKEKLIALRNQIAAIEMPGITSPDAQIIAQGVATLLGKVCAFIDEKAATL